MVKYLSEEFENRSKHVKHIDKLTSGSTLAKDYNVEWNKNQ